MADWTEDPKIRSLMAHLGKTGSTGRPTRSAYVASHMDRILKHAKTRIAERDGMAKEEQEMSAEYGRLKTFVTERNKREAELRRSLLEVKRHRLEQDPKADALQLDRDAAKVITEFQAEQEKAPEKMEDLTRSITMKRTAIRRTEDRIQHLRKQAMQLLREWQKSRQKPAA
jgi:hypothetical protein